MAQVTIYPFKSKTGKAFIVFDSVLNQKYIIEQPVFSLRNYPHLRNRELVVGFVGPRGSGKTVGGTRTLVLDYLMAGYNAWSNIDIAINVPVNGKLKELRTKPLDKLDLQQLDRVYENGVIFMSEVNTEIADARRAMAESNIKFSYIVQQIRHRKLNVIWDTQSEMMIENRLRWQTDVFIKCQDISLLPSSRHTGIGELSKWELYDMTGIVKGENPVNTKDALFDTMVMWNRPWWNCYDTSFIHGLNEVKPEEEQQSEAEIKALEIASDEKIIAQLKSGGRILKDEVWYQFDVYDHIFKREIIQSLLKQGIIQDPPGSKTHFKYVENVKVKV